MAETNEDFILTIEALQARLNAAEEALRAIQSGEVDALVIYGEKGDHVYTLEGADHTYRMMVEKIQEGVATLDTGGMVLYANRQLADMLGERLESLLGASLSTYIQTFDQKVFKALLNKGAVGTGKGELTLLRKDGLTLPVLLTMNSVETRGRQVIGLIATDLTEQKHHEEILAAERLARSILEQAAETIIVTDHKGTIIRASQAAHSFLSSNPLFQPFEKAFPLQASDPRGQRKSFSIEAALSGRTFHAVEARIRAPGPDGAVPTQDCYVLVSAAPLRNDRQEILGCIVTLTNITERKQAEKDLQESENRLRKLVEGNIIGMTIRDTRGHIRDANSVFLNLIGYTGDDLQAGKLITSDLTPRAFWAADQKAIEEALATGSCKPYEKEYFHKDGRAIPVMVAYTRINDRTDELIGFVLDLTSLKKAQIDLEEYAEKLKRSNQDLEQFAFVASHDLQEPLRKIIRFGDSVTERLKKVADSTNLDEIVDYVQRMQNAADRLQSMIDGLLELSRISTQRKVIENVDLKQVADEVISDIELRIHQAGARIELGPLPVIEADPIQMHQLLQNLITNALKFHKAGEQPFISVRGHINPDKRKPSDCVLIYVQDNGIGFEEKEARWIFQPFRRLHDAHEYEGSGMGLAICQKIVERHHGTITVQSRPGEGSTFIIELPLKQAP